MTEKTIEERYSEEALRGVHARALLENELLTATLDRMEAEIIEQWGLAPARDAEGKEALWLMYKTTKKFREILKASIVDGDFARAKLAEMRKRPMSERLRKVVGGMNISNS